MQVNHIKIEFFESFIFAKISRLTVCVVTCDINTGIKHSIALNVLGIKVRSCICQWHGSFGCELNTVV